MDDRTGRLDVPNATAPADRDPDARASEIRAEIERTREDLSETVDAIQEKLRPAISSRARPRAPPTRYRTWPRRLQKR